LDQILSLLVPIVLESTKIIKPIKTIKDTYVSKQFWHNEMANVMKKGFKYTLGDRYLTILEKEFDIKFKHKKSLHSEDILRILYDKMIEKYSKRHSTLLYNKMKFISDIEFVNFNKKAFNEISNFHIKNKMTKMTNVKI